MDTKYVIPRPDLHSLGFRALWELLQYLPAKYKVKTKKSSERGALALCHMANTALVIALRS